MNSSVSINKLAKPLVEKLLENATYLNLGIDSTEGGGKIIDAGRKKTWKNCVVK